MIISDYLRLVRFSHTLFAMPFAFLGGLMAFGLNVGMAVPVYPRFFDLVGILLCMVFVRNAAMGFNRYADCEIDARNPRTLNRHIPAGIISARGVLFFVFFNSAGFVLSTFLFLPNLFPLIVSVPLLLFIFGYSYAKRWTVSAHLWLGMVLMCAPIGAWLVVRPVFDLFSMTPMLLGLAVMFWATGFDLIYACQDAKIDADQGLYSVPGRYGVWSAFCVARVCHIISVILFAMIPIFYPLFSYIFEAGVIIVALILITEHFIATPRKKQQPDLTKINIAFFQMNIIVSIGLLIVGILDVIF
ncbi:MAG: putative 4-hydroxybenzoate polyprenyltransferase [Planctomycetaceae bacterium]|jgi:4-hydroxybenzoate polyprenyltransferase|nr:putative 4-hydroxybenzoate polyprenyltransferase [Planctomycetaceae bacterium]